MHIVKVLTDDCPQEKKVSIEVNALSSPSISAIPFTFTASTPTMASSHSYSQSSSVGTVCSTSVTKPKKLLKSSNIGYSSTKLKKMTKTKCLGKNNTCKFYGSFRS